MENPVVELLGTVDSENTEPIDEEVTEVELASADDEEITAVEEASIELIIEDEGIMAEELEERADVDFMLVEIETAVESEEVGTAEVVGAT